MRKEQEVELEVTDEKMLRFFLIDTEKYENEGSACLRYSQKGHAQIYKDMIVQTFQFSKKDLKVVAGRQDNEQDRVRWRALNHCGDP